MKVNSLSILLNILLGFIIIVGVILCLKKDSLNDTTSNKKSNPILRDLPKKKQGKQVKKDNSQKIIKELKSNILIIQNDNMQLSNDKEDLKKIIQNLKKQFKKQRNRILQQNIERINETEMQHYKNISELRAKINELQKENIKLLEKNSIEIIALKAKINILNDKLSKLKKIGNIKDK